MKKILDDVKWLVDKLESKEDGISVGVTEKWWDSNSGNGNVFFVNDKTSNKKYLYQPKSKLIVDEETNEVVKDTNMFSDLNVELKKIATQNKETPTVETADTPKVEPTVPDGEIKKESLDTIYNSMLEERKNISKFDITSSTHKLLAKAPPRGKFVTGLEQEFFGIDPELMQQLPMKSVQLFQDALIHLISATQDNPMLRQALRTMIKNQIKAAEAEVDEGEVPEKENKNEAIITSFQETLKQLSEAKAMRFNYKVLLELDPTKITDPQFIQLLSTFDLLALSRMQKQGVLLLLKKLAEIADTNPQIAQALTRIVRMENKVEQPKEEPEA